MNKQIESNLNFLVTVANMVNIATDNDDVIAIGFNVGPKDEWLKVAVHMTNEGWHKYFGDRAEFAQDHDGGYTKLWARHNGVWFFTLEKEATA